MDLGQMTTYGVMGVALEMFIWSRPQWYMANQIKSGVIVTGIIPVAFMNYYPSLMLLGKLDSQNAIAWLGYLSPAVALLLIAVASGVWHYVVIPVPAASDLIEQLAFSPIFEMS